MSSSLLQRKRDPEDHHEVRGKDGIEPPAITEYDLDVNSKNREY